MKEVLVYENQRVQVFDDEIRRPDGKPDTYFHMQYRNAPDGAVIVPELPDGRLLMLGIRRYAVAQKMASAKRMLRYASCGKKQGCNPRN
jgi:hypothetical protein